MSTSFGLVAPRSSWSWHRYTIGCTVLVPYFSVCYAVALWAVAQCSHCSEVILTKFKTRELLVFMLSALKA
jgi:hypothetical protein